MVDYGVQYTETELKKIKKKIQSIYAQAEKDMEEKLDDFISRFQDKNQIHLKELAEGTITEEEYQSWMKGQVFQGKQWASKKEQLAQTLYNANEEAVKIINGGKISVFAENANYMAYTMEHGTGVNFGFNLYDSTSVTRLIRDDPNILPFKKVKKIKDQRWNFKNIRSQITQGIIQGERLDQIADRLAKVTGSRNRSQMLTQARTAMTSAQNGGRQMRLQEASEKGIQLHKEWMATFDELTRYTHRELDGQKQPIDKPFVVEGYEIDYPGDPHAHPSLVYNCRCTMGADIDDYPEEYQRYDNIDGHPVDQMTYKEWYKAKYDTDVMEGGNQNGTS